MNEEEILRPTIEPEPTLEDYKEPKKTLINKENIYQFFTVVLVVLYLILVGCMFNYIILDRELDRNTKQVCIKNECKTVQKTLEEIKIYDEKLDRASPH